MPKAHQHRSTAAHDFKGLADWIEVFRAGTHTDSKGTACSFTTADLDQMVSNVALGKPPAVLGHPKQDDPAYAWAELRRDGESLFAKFDDINPAFESAVQSGAYRNRSVSVLKDKAHGWRVRHIGWLGAAPPALDGLKPLDMAAYDADAETHDFADPDDLSTAWALDDVASLLRGLREWVIATQGLDAANNILPDWRIANVASAAEKLRQAALAEPDDDTNPINPSPAYSAGKAGANPMSFTAEDLARAATEAAARTKAETEAKFSAQTAELRKLQSERQAERIGVAIGTLTAAGKVTPAEVVGMADFMAALENGTAEFSFSAPGTATPTKKTPAQWFADFMAARAPVVKLGHGNTAIKPDDAPAVDTTDARAIAAAAQDYMAAESAKGRTVILEVAVAHVMQQGAVR